MHPDLAQMRPAVTGDHGRPDSSAGQRQVDQLLDLDHKLQLDQIEAAARAIGQEFHIELRPAA
jgi:hypothetical protein